MMPRPLAPSDVGSVRDDGAAGGRDGVAEVEVEVIGRAGFLRMIRKPAAVGLLTYVVGIALLLARAAARDRLPFTATIAVVLTLLMPAVYVAGIRSIRSGMSFRRELVRFSLRPGDGARLASTTAPRRCLELGSGYAVLRRDDRGVPLVTADGTSSNLREAGLAVRLLVTRRGTVVGVQLGSGTSALRRYAVGPSVALAPCASTPTSAG
jgi:hypothetical protein